MSYGISAFSETAFASLGGGIANANGQNINTNQGSVSITGTANVPVTGQSIISTLGTAVLDANTFATVSGEAMTAEEGIVDPSPDASVTGIGISASLSIGTVVIGTGNVELNGIGFTANLGTAVLDANTIASPNGQEMTMQEGTATATDSVARPTGIEMSVAQGNARTLIWIPVDPGVGTTWNNVGTGASSTYTNVDTGTKPVWTEVDTAA
jgi:hypothetical protein